MHPADRKRIDRLLDAPEGESVRLRAGAEGRVSILIGGRSFGTLAGDLAERAGLESGREWTPKLAMRIAKAVEDDIAREAAVRLLAMRERSKGELLLRLTRRGVKPDKAERLVSDLARSGAVDDTRFAGLVARSIVRDKPAGARLIRAKLREKRVDPETASAAAAEALAGRDPLSDALALARSRLKSLGPRLDNQTRARRLLGLLARRGFDSQTAMSAVRTLVRFDSVDAADDA
jgi:regulatory protein